MSRQLIIVLEHDGENPVRDDFVCKIDELYYSCLRDWEDLYDNDLSKFSPKKNSLKTLRLSEGHGCYSWGINNIVLKIESVKRELQLDTELEEQDKKNLEYVIYDLQRLHDLAMEKCSLNNLDPEKCYLAWWINR